MVFMVTSSTQRGSSRDPIPGRGRVGPLRRTSLILLSIGFGLASSAAAVALASDLDLGDAEKLYRAGRYDECARLAGEEMGKGFWNEHWAHWKIKAELARGKRAEALATFEAVSR